jgi:hypothetical protein
MIVAIVISLPVLAYSQASNEMIVPDYFDNGSYLNNVIMGDTTASGARVNAQRVYVLKRNGVYLSNALIRNVNWTLTIKGANGTGAKPVIYNYKSGATYVNRIIEANGDVSVKNVALVGYTEWAVPTEISLVPQRIINMAATGFNITIDSCVFSSCTQSCLGVDVASKNIKVTNTIFTYGGNMWNNNMGNGRAIDLRDVAVDTLAVQNCTILYCTDRAIRHYSATKTGALKYFLFDHNTVLNCFSEHGSLSLGNVTGPQIITNNLFVDHYLAGNDSTDAVRLTEFGYTGELGPTGKFRMTMVGSTPNDSSSWVVKNNFYVITPALQRWYDSTSAANGNIGLGNLIPLTWFISKKIGADSLTAFTKTSLTFTKAPATPIQYCWWYWQPNPIGPGRTKANTGFAAANADFERHPWNYFTDTMKLSYPTTAAAFTGAQKGLPAGDLNWFPAQKATWLTTAVETPTSRGVPITFSLGQNYPNPFNPSTTITFTAPKTGHVTLKVFNTLGQVVATLVDGEYTAGTHEVRFDASVLSSGVYFYTLKSNDFSATKKMMLVK